MMNIPMSWKIIAVIVALTCTYKYGHHNGWWERDAEMQIEIAKKNDEARSTEQRLSQQLNDQSTKLLEANNAVTKKQSDLDRAIRAGRVRLPAASCVQASAGSSAPSGNQPEAPSESERETLRLIAEIAADGDRAINQLNACIDAYNQVKEAINGQR